MQNNLVAALTKLGVLYKFWHGDDGALTWTNLNGTDTTTAMAKLDVVALLGEEHGAKVQTLWREFMDIYERINATSVPDLKQLQTDIDAWLRLYLQQFQLNLDEHAHCLCGRGHVQHP